MNETRKLKRSPEMKLAGYYLARCGDRRTLPAKWPIALNVNSWEAAFDIFYAAMGDGRTRPQFKNSLKPVRNCFDLLYENGRKPWGSSLSTSDEKIHKEWKERSDSELKEHVFNLLKIDLSNAEPVTDIEARTESGERTFAWGLHPNDGDEEEFNPANIEDARKKISVSIKERRGQTQFRKDLIAAYRGQCAITGCKVLDVLEAAHILPYRGPDTNKVTNGLLLRSDLHTLFDCGLMGIDSEKMSVILSPKLRNSEYSIFHNANLKVPKNPNQCPSREALNMQLNSMEKSE